MEASSVEASLDALAERIVTQRKKRLYIGLGLIVILVGLMLLLLVIGRSGEATMKSLEALTNRNEAGLAENSAKIDRQEAILAENSQTVARQEAVLAQNEAAIDRLRSQGDGVAAQVRRLDGAVASLQETTDSLARSSLEARLDALVERKLSTLFDASAQRALLERIDSLEARLAVLARRLDVLEDQTPHRLTVLLEDKAVDVPSLGFRLVPGKLSGRVLRDFTLSTLADGATVFQGAVTLDEEARFQYEACQYALRVRRAYKRLLFKDLLEVFIERRACQE